MTRSSEYDKMKRRVMAASRVSSAELYNILASKEANKFPELAIDKMLREAGLLEEEEDEEYD